MQTMTSLRGLRAGGGTWVADPDGMDNLLWDSRRGIWFGDDKRAA